jgi:hypothetical protein
MLTGLEQYSLERAGYFIRRAFIAPNVLPDSIGHPAVTQAESPRKLVDLLLPTVQSALGQGPITPYTGSNAGEAGWTRGYPISWDLPPVEQIGALARTMEHLQVRAAVSRDESLALLPGTHAAPPSAEDAAQLRANPTADMPGMVRVRLAPGDTLFWNTNVLHRHAVGETGQVICVTFVTDKCPTPSWATDLSDRIGRDMR